jgi:sarcosine oxidase gamma subunit
VLLHRAAPTSYELYLPRTFAVSLWEWLCDAALAEGFEVGAIT